MLGKHWLFGCTHAILLVMFHFFVEYIPEISVFALYIPCPASDLSCLARRKMVVRKLSRFFWKFVALLETFLSLNILCFQVSYDIRSYAVWTQFKQLRVEAWLCFVLFVCFVSTKKKFTTKSNLFFNRVNNVKIERIWRKLLTLLYMFDIPWRFLIQFLRRTSQFR